MWLGEVGLELPGKYSGEAARMKKIRQLTDVGRFLNRLLGSLFLKALSSSLRRCCCCWLCQWEYGSIAHLFFSPPFAACLASVCVRFSCTTSAAQLLALSLSLSRKPDHLFKLSLGSVRPAA